MMNHHVPPGSQMPANGPIPHQSRRHQEYHQYQQHGPPRSPGPHNPYAAYQHYPSPYYPHPNQMPYPMPRWPSHHQYPSPYPMHPQAQYPPRSPMIASSPSHPQVMPSPSTRPPPFSHVPFPPQSPHPAAPPTPAASIPASVPSPREPPSRNSTPQPTSRRESAVTQPALPMTRMPFYPELPWYFPSEARHSFPPKAAKRRRSRQNLHVANDAVALPSRMTLEKDVDTVESEVDMPSVQVQLPAVVSKQESVVPTAQPSLNQVETLLRTNAPEEASQSINTPTAAGHARKDTRTAVPRLPALPNLAGSRQKATPIPQLETPPVPANKPTESQSVDTPPAETADVQPPVTTPQAAKSVAKSWADLVRTRGSIAAAAPLTNGSGATNGTQPSRAGSLADALSHFQVDSDEKVAFLEPRGLVNTGNMCYMNSILQVLVFCVPFFNFLDQVGKRAAHSFKSDTPLVDAMIMFMREFKVIDSAESSDKLRMRLKDGELEKYGDAFIPEYVYDVIKRLPMFSSMRRGHQQDAEEFLGFLLAGLHDECVAVMRSQGIVDSAGENATSPTSPVSQSADAGWLEVGPKQRAAVTRDAGDSSTTSPVTRIFGGALRSELRVPGLKNSVILEPYQPLQLDIGAANVNNITDALKSITKPESLTGDFNSPRGPGTTATKQVFIESLPPVLILHLKRFQYDSSGGTQKIWKRVGYPLELEIPKEVFAPAKRGGLAVKGGPPRYRLTAVVYHHGKSAAGGHYTADMLRQDRREWIRMDDTVIRRIRPEDVAEGGSEEDPKILAKALEQHKADEDTAKRNLFEGLDGEDDRTDDGRSWSEVNGLEGKKKWAGVAANTGSATPTTAGKRTPRRENVKDNKVAYILLYEKISA